MSNAIFVTCLECYLAANRTKKVCLRNLNKDCFSLCNQSKSQDSQSQQAEETLQLNKVRMVLNKERLIVENQPLAPVGISWGYNVHWGGEHK